MKAIVKVISEDGSRYEGEMDLLPVRNSDTKSVSRISKPPKALPLTFDTNERAFAKKHAKGLGGPKKFALLLAYLTKGDLKKQVSLGEIQSLWNKMTALLEGKFNRVYSNRAKENGWVDSPKPGVYVLRPDWQEILKQR